ncbi:ArsR/SmtB family transcription factor [Algicella marina]|uniref:Metalloregulator ArsR/SmtB family transcription factor n=1 Tax=Algicella marina TaxID=2683284 RepID=A0A6P1T3K0_9RHOB|nr:helix-turn-helix domain-containing protein [Algicella marina]QHQ36046.1 metalloregulator ArsR/SmtB family transcription factor [Algicella marina]
MEKNHAINSLAALAHDMRIDIFRLLVKAGADGLAAGEIAQSLDVRSNTLSNNLNILARSGLVRSAREGRSIRYFARVDGMQNLLGFLMEDCCGGRPDLCAKVFEQIACNMET